MWNHILLIEDFQDNGPSGCLRTILNICICKSTARPSDTKRLDNERLCLLSFIFYIEFAS